MKLFAAFQQVALLRTLKADHQSSTGLYSTVAPMENATSMFVNDPEENSGLASLLDPLPESSRRIYLLRHGETDWNKQGKIQGGGYDIPLNENGRSQARAVAKALNEFPLTVIASSTLSRAAETADILWNEHKCSQRVLDPGFMEMGFGEFEGVSFHSEDSDPAIKARFKLISNEVKQNVEKAFPGGGESTSEVQKRSRDALYKLLNDYPNDKHIAIVSHGRTNKVLLAATALNDVSKSPTIKQSNTCINVIDIDQNGAWSIQVLNYIDHVKDIVIRR